MSKRSNTKRKPAWVATHTKRVEALQSAFTDAFENLDSDRHGNDYLKNQHAKKVRHLGLALLEDLVGTDHRMWLDFEESTNGLNAGGFDSARGIADALEIIVKDDWLTKTRAALAGSMFSDYLDMAEHLAEQKLDSAAVVIAMGSLEVHLRRLARAAGIAVDTTDRAGYTRPKAADTLNADLKKVGAYDAAEQKQITAFLEIRKHAAHGDHDKVRSGSAEMVIPWIRMFIKSHPA
jgi:hypothetical protein